MAEIYVNSLHEQVMPRVSGGQTSPECINCSTAQHRSWLAIASLLCPIPYLGVSTQRALSWHSCSVKHIAFGMFSWANRPFLWSVLLYRRCLVLLPICGHALLFLCAFTSEFIAGHRSRKPETCPVYPWKVFLGKLFPHIIPLSLLCCCSVATSLHSLLKFHLAYRCSVTLYPLRVFIPQSSVVISELLL